MEDNWSDRKNAFVERTRSFLDTLIVGKTDTYPGEWAFGEYDTITLAILLEVALGLLEERG